MDESERELFQRVLVEASREPETQAQLASLGHFLLCAQAAVVDIAHELTSFLIRHRVPEKVVAAAEVVRAAAREVEASPPSIGYEPLLISRGTHPLMARMAARMILQYGERRARRSNHEQQVIPAALRSLSRPGRRPRTVARIAASLRDLPHAAISILAVFERVDCDDQGQHFVALLGKAAAADPAACRGLAGIAQSVAGQIETRRGPRMSVASASHQLTLFFASTPEQPAGYTFTSHKDEFSDPATRATMLEFGIPHFDPRPAVRRLRKEQDK